MLAESPIGDAVDRILLAELVAGDAPDPRAPARVVVVDDITGALSVEIRRRFGPETEVSRSHDSLLDQRTVTAVLADEQLAVEPVTLGPATFLGADLVVLRLPRSLAALEDLAYAIASQADQAVRVLAGGREKHLSRGMNAVLARHFAEVSASRGQQKCRVLRAAGPQPGPPPASPAQTRLEEFGLTVCAVGGAFAGPDLDLGTRLLLGSRDSWPAGARSVVDLGCGTGLLAAAAGVRPGVEVLAVDESWSAVQSARATAAANGLSERIRVDWTDGLESVPDGSIDLILCNPPFHRGAARDSTAAFAMIAAAGRALRPGGELWLVYNAHLPYLPALRRIGSTSIVARDRSYLVTRTIRRARPAATA